MSGYRPGQCMVLFSMCLHSRISFQVVQQLIDIMQKANEVGYCWNLNSVACSMQAETLSNLVNIAIIIKS